MRLEFGSVLVLLYTIQYIMAEPITEAAKTLPPEAEKKKEQGLLFFQLFSFADKYDWFLMIFGSLGAIVHGSSMPTFFFLLFGEMVNGFGKNQTDIHKMTREVYKYALYFVYFGLVSLCAFLLMLRLHVGCTLERGK